MKQAMKVTVRKLNREGTLLEVIVDEFQDLQRVKRTSNKLEAKDVQSWLKDVIAASQDA